MDRRQVLLVSVLAGAGAGAVVFFFQPFTGWILLTTVVGAVIGAGVGGLLIAFDSPRQAP